MRDYQIEMASLHISDSILVTHWQLTKVSERKNKTDKLMKIK